MHNQTTFNWNSTNCPIIIFIPNFGRKTLLIPTLQRFKTNLPKNDWKFLVVNDGFSEDLSDLEHFNLCWFTFEREPIERNGALIRNYVIKRLQCQTICQRDPEIMLDGGDYLQHVYENQDKIYRPASMIELQPNAVQEIFDNPFCDLARLDVLRSWKVTPYNYEAFHNGCAIPLQLLRNIGGYDENFSEGYGYEDVDLLQRLKLTDYKFLVDNKIIGYHLWHQMRRKFHKTINKNGIIYENKMKNLQVIANNGKEWGKGI